MKWKIYSFLKAYFNVEDRYCVPRGVTLIFSHIHRLGPFLGVQNSEFQYFFGFSEKLIFFWGMKILWIFFLGHHKIGLV